MKGEGKAMKQMSLFDDREVYNPLASRLRPDDLDGFVGQEHLLGKGKLLRQLIEQDKIPSMIFWGPPGVEMCIRDSPNVEAREGLLD